MGAIPQHELLYTIALVALQIGLVLGTALLALIVIAAFLGKEEAAKGIDLQRLQAVGAEHWGVTQTIKVQWASEIEISGDPSLVGAVIFGAHAYEKIPDMHHRIYLRRDRGGRSVLITLAHELEHCKQAEEAGYSGWTARKERENKLSYNDRPMEIEARKAEAHWEKLEGVVVQRREE